MEAENRTADKIADIKKRVQHMKERLFRLSENWYVGMLVILTIHAVLSYVQVDIMWEEMGQGIPVIQFLITYIVLQPNHLLFALAVIRYLCAEEYNIKRIVAAFVIYLISAHAVKINQYDEILMMLLLMIGAWGISFRKLIRVYFVTVLIIFVCVVAASQLGWIEELVYKSRGGRRAFGFTYPTRFASHVFFLMLWYWYLRDRKLRYQEAFLALGAGIFVQLCSKARLNAVMLIMLAAVMLWQTFSFRRAEQRGTEYQMNSWLSSLLVLSPIGASLVINVMTVLYSADSALWKSLDSLMSSRLVLTQKAMDIYGICLWGQEITLSGNGGLGKTASKYFYIDSAWMQFSVQYGLVMLVILLVLFWIVGIRARKYGNWIILWILALVSLHSMIEPQILQLQYCPLILTVFAGLKENEMRKTDYEEN